jgi:NAD(P)-dependent dehydrogenase (short-subunit alcohol dehydrogenase family)
MQTVSSLVGQFSAMQRDTRYGTSQYVFRPSRPLGNNAPGAVKAIGTQPASPMSSSYFDLAGKIVLVTGGARGIGLAIARGFVDCGAKLIICDRNADTLAHSRSVLGESVETMVVDVADESAVIALRDQVKSQFGRLDVLVNNAGIGVDSARMERTSTASWNSVLDINLDGVFFCCKHLGSMMISERSGAIINISSVVGQLGFKRQIPYCASKGGVEQLTKALAFDWAEYGIRVNAIGFGFIQTDLTSEMTSHPQIAPRLLSRIPLARFGDLSEVAGAAIFLASPGASYVTGHTLMVDGGWKAA